MSRNPQGSSDDNSVAKRRTPSFGAVGEFAHCSPTGGRAVEPLRSQTRKTAKVSSYVEVALPSAEGGTGDRPDGLICVSKRNTNWTALIEAKINNVEIDEVQIHRYAESAKRLGVDAVITLSNQLVPTNSYTVCRPQAPRQQGAVLPSVMGQHTDPCGADLERPPIARCRASLGIGRDG